jgi:hypothetical protein
MTTSIDTSPPDFQILTTETLPITVEWVDLIGIGSIVTTPSAVMYDNSNGIAIPTGFVNNYGANGTQAQYILDGTQLQAGHTYTAILTVNASAQIYKSRLQVNVPR